MAVFRCRISRLAGSKGDIGVQVASILALRACIPARTICGLYLHAYRRDKERRKYSLVNTIYNDIVFKGT